MSILLIILKAIFLYLLLIILLRLLGKKEVGQLSIFDFTIILIIADIASIGIDNNEFFIPAIFCLIILASLNKLISYLMLKNKKIRSICDGKETIIVLNGNIYYENMNNEMYSIDDLITQIRVNGIIDISDVLLAVLETNGSLSVIKREENSLRIPIIISGNYIKNNFKYLDISIKEIEVFLEENTLILKNVLYASYGDLMINYYYKNNNKEEALSLHKKSLRK